MYYGRLLITANNKMKHHAELIKKNFHDVVDNQLQRYVLWIDIFRVIGFDDEAISLQICYGGAFIQTSSMCS
jgi:hypothetical protein